MLETMTKDRTVKPWAQSLAESLLLHGVTWVAQVPDEVTGDVLNRLESDAHCTVLTVTREEEGVGLLAGVSLSGERSALIVQASGIGNSLNALASLCVPCKIPLLLIISERGGLHEFNPCQVPLGKNVDRLLDAIGVQTFRIADRASVSDIVTGAVTLAFSTQQPVALVLTSTLTGGR